uniref:Uncharacterized protein n=1 Tax=Arundo donax TaxID=35708 RepID=A0A0A9BD65_ARUDO
MKRLMQIGLQRMLSLMASLK